MSAISPHYDYSLVALSYLIATVGAFAALQLASRIQLQPGQTRFFPLITTAIVFGGASVWSMHFVGMLAYKPGIPVSYDIAITLFSLLVPIAVSIIGLWLAYNQRFGLMGLIGGGIIMGAGVAFMHYTGMAAMRMHASMSYDPFLFVLSIIIAFAAATVALWISRHASGWLRHVSPPVMGVAVCGMHYTGMAAMRLTPNNKPIDYFAGAAAAPTLEVLVVSVAGGVIILALIVGLIDREPAALQEA